MEILELEPKAVWKNFSLLNEVPRPSKKEEKVIQFIKDFGESLGLDTTVDDTGNVIIRKPASPGMEDRKTVILQSHLDMVTQKNSDTDFDFDTQGINMYVDGDWVKARGTTLGADNGIGVATIMSILESNEIVHPPLEALFTIDEETGMTGAFGLEPGALHGDILLNLDTEDDDEITIGCAGGVDVTATRKYITESVHRKGISIKITGLRGGHSGAEIHEGRGNANVLLGRILYAGINTGIQIVSIDAGGLRNAIPREAFAQIVVKDFNAFKEASTKLKAEILDEFKSNEKDLHIDFNIEDINGAALSKNDSAQFIRALRAAHNGVYRMSPDVEGLVESSNNIARISISNGNAEVLCLARSSVESTKDSVSSQLKASFELAGMEVELSGSYPGWKPNPHASIIEVMEDIYKLKFDESPHVVAIHAGLECGIIGAPYPEMEMVSFGPTIKGAHSPDERASISSTQKFWSYLLDILKEIPEK